MIRDYSTDQRPKDVASRALAVVAGEECAYMVAAAAEAYEEGLLGYGDAAAELAYNAAKRAGHYGRLAQSNEDRLDPA